MKQTICLFTLAAALGAAPASALTIDCIVDGPFLKKESCVQAVKQKLGGTVATIPDLEQGAKHRLRVRIASKYLAPSDYSHLTDFQLQRRVVDQETLRAYWATIHAWSSWGTVPSETELRQAVGEAMVQQVNAWVSD